MQLGPNISTPKHTVVENIKFNKSKKLNNHRQVRKSPQSLDSNGVIDPQIDENLSTNSSGTALAISGSSSNDIMSQPTRDLGSQCPSSNFNGAITLLPPPNATVVVCVLAGTGRADLWVRNNRGQTPLDLCPADQSLRRALIKCCDAAAQARSSKTSTFEAETDAAPPTPGVHQWPPHNLKLLSNNTIKSPHCRFTANNPGLSNKCSKTLTTRNNVEFVNTQTKCVKNFLNVNDNITSSSVDVPLQNNSSTRLTVNKVSASTNLNARNDSNDINSNDHNNIVSVYGAQSTACNDNCISTITNYRFVKKF